MAAQDSDTPIGSRGYKLIDINWMLIPVGLLLVVTLVALYRPGRSAASDGKLQVVFTFLPMYVFTQNVVGDVPGVSVELLVDRDMGCPHSYSLTGQDIKKISQADVIVANGLGIEPFLERMLHGQTKAKVITIADDCDVLRLAPGEAHEHEHEHGHAEHDAAASEPSPDADHSEVNPHTWVSPRQAMVEVRTLANKLSEIDRPHAAQYLANATAYIARLTALADKMESAAHGFENRNIVTGHAAFDYLARDLGLNVVATLHIVPGETGSASEMAHIIDTIRKTRAAAVFQEPPFSDKMADTIARDAGVPMYPLNPLNSDAGLSKSKTVEDTRRMYEEAMLQNLATLQQALGTTATTKPANRN